MTATEIEPIHGWIVRDAAKRVLLKRITENGFMVGKELDLAAREAAKESEYESRTGAHIDQEVINQASVVLIQVVLYD